MLQKLSVNSQQSKRDPVIIKVLCLPVDCAKIRNFGLTDRTNNQKLENFNFSFLFPNFSRLFHGKCIQKNKILLDFNTGNDWGL